jgi:hypothetical protein
MRAHTHARAYARTHSYLQLWQATFYPSELAKNARARTRRDKHLEHYTRTATPEFLRDELSFDKNASMSLRLSSEAYAYTERNARTSSLCAQMQPVDYAPRPSALRRHYGFDYAQHDRALPVLAATAAAGAVVVVLALDDVLPSALSPTLSGVCARAAPLDDLSASTGESAGRTVAVVVVVVEVSVGVDMVSVVVVVVVTVDDDAAVAVGVAATCMPATPVAPLAACALVLAPALAVCALAFAALAAAADDGSDACALCRDTALPLGTTGLLTTGDTDGDAANFFLMSATALADAPLCATHARDQ